MMNENIEKLNMAIVVMNSINVCGKMNMRNLSGAIEIVETVVNNLVEGAEEVSDDTEQ